MFHEFHLGCMSVAGVWVSHEGAQKILPNSEYRTSPFSFLVGYCQKKKKRGQTDRISAWQACVPATYHLVIFYMLTQSSFVPLFPGIGTGVTTTQFLSPLSLPSSKAIMTCALFLHFGISSISLDISKINTNTPAAVSASPLNAGLHQVDMKPSI